MYIYIVRYLFGVSCLVHRLALSRFCGDNELGPTLLLTIESLSLKA